MGRGQDARRHKQEQGHPENALEAHFVLPSYAADVDRAGRCDERDSEESRRKMRNVRDSRMRE